jgi:phosphatidylserine/phosphatidylglycerophosphate/cardiolipin synthase-like enzyme
MASLAVAIAPDFVTAPLAWADPVAETSCTDLLKIVPPGRVRCSAPERVSVTCATYNFSPSSNMWKALSAASEQPGVTVVVYVDAEKGDPLGVRAKLPRATVYRSAQLPDGKPIVSHTKFIIIDHQIVLLTSANFSCNAENSNVEFELKISDNGLAMSIEKTMASKHGSLYELV